MVSQSKTDTTVNGQPDTDINGQSEIDANGQSDTESLPLRLHPRVFAALGKDLVTNDLVAVMELVKNAYDAFAENVWIEFSEDDDSTPCLEIRDDGIGMTRDIIENVWCLVATPNRQRNPIVKKGNKQRRVVGAKGLGRLSAARLGKRLRMLTKSQNQPTWRVEVDWVELAQASNLEQSTVSLKEYKDKTSLGSSGTSLKIIGLESEWDEQNIEELSENLARLLSPFSQTKDFNIYLTTADSAEVVHVSSSEFLSQPKYLIKGSVDKCGNIDGSYRYSPISIHEAGRTRSIDLTWYNVLESIRPNERDKYPAKRPTCGTFEFEIRAWDIGPNDTQEIADRFKVRKNLVRRSIRTHKGVSVYRDGVLVLPKSENARDWLGLDLRRVGRVGPRLSTTQLVGYVSITAKDNPGIEDTSDRERLSSSAEVAQFEAILFAIITTLENERNIDRIVPGQERPMEELFADMDASDLVAQVSALAAKGASAADTVSLIQNFDETLANRRDLIQERFVYYSRLATVGTIAQYIIHEIRNRATTIGRAIRSVHEFAATIAPKHVIVNLDNSRQSLRELEVLADSFAPLASRRYMRKPRKLIVEDSIKDTLRLTQPDIRSRDIKCLVPNSRTMVLAQPAELNTILINLVSNASYWLGEVDRKSRNIEFQVIADVIGTKPRAHIWVHDSGPGIDPDDIERIFLPGVTRKPGGIGMGLNVAAELVAVYDGEMRAMREPTKLGGASFGFDLPMVIESEEDNR